MAGRGLTQNLFGLPSPIFPTPAPSLATGIPPSASLELAVCRENTVTQDVLWRRQPVSTCPKDYY